MPLFCISCPPSLKLWWATSLWEVGGDKEIRTPDPLNANQVLYQLSYIPVVFPCDDESKSKLNAEASKGWQSESAKGLLCG